MVQLLCTSGHLLLCIHVEMDSVVFEYVGEVPEFSFIGASLVLASTRASLETNGRIAMVFN